MEKRVRQYIRLCKNRRISSPVKAYLLLSVIRWIWGGANRRTGAPEVPTPLETKTAARLSSSHPLM